MDSFFSESKERSVTQIKIWPILSAGRSKLLSNHSKTVPTTTTKKNSTNKGWEDKRKGIFKEDAEMLRTIFLRSEKQVTRQ